MRCLRLLFLSFTIPPPHESHTPHVSHTLPPYELYTPLPHEPHTPPPIHDICFLSLDTSLPSSLTFRFLINRIFLMNLILMKMILLFLINLTLLLLLLTILIYLLLQLLLRHTYMLLRYVYGVYWQNRRGVFPVEYWRSGRYCVLLVDPTDEFWGGRKITVEEMDKCMDKYEICRRENRSWYRRMSLFSLLVQSHQ